LIGKILKTIATETASIFSILTVPVRAGFKAGFLGLWISGITGFVGF
jgi:hypothetical protein